MSYSINTTKAYFEGYRIEVPEIEKFFIAEYNHEFKVWNLSELDEEGDVYGHKVWVNSYDRLKHAKMDIICNNIEM